MLTSIQRHPLKVLAVLSLVGFALRFGWLLSVAGWTLPSEYSRFDNGDYALYAIGAEAFAVSGTFSNSLFLVRPPLFSLMLWALGNQALAVLIANVLLGTALIPLTYVFARRLDLSPLMSLSAALIVTVDPASVAYSAFLGAEPLANFWLMAGFVSFASAIRPNLSNRRGVLYMVLAGVFHGASSLTRPLSYLLWLPLGAWLVVFRRWKLALALGVVGVAVMAGWMAHNAVTFGNASFSTIGTYNLLYYRAASVEYQATGWAIDDVYAELSRRVEGVLGHDVSQVDAGTRHGHYAAPAELQSAMTSTALNVFRAHPKEYFFTIPVGLYRILGQTNLFSGGFAVADVLWNLALIGFACGGLIKMARRGDWQWASLLTLLCVYYIGSTVLIQTSGIDTRARTMIIPFMAIAIMCGWWKQGEPEKLDAG